MRKKSKIAKIADALRILGSEVRLQILANLDKDGCNVKEIQERLNLKQSTVSQNLKLLRMQGIVKAVRKGNRRCYEVVNQKGIVEMIIEYLRCLKE